MIEEPEITPERFDALRQRLERGQQAVRKLWDRPCRCLCGCPINHPGRQEGCVLCLAGDHWTPIAEYLDQVMGRRNA